MDMLKRVQYAICKAGSPFRCGCEQGDGGYCFSKHSAARAALEAMKEPTEAMTDEGDGALSSECTCERQAANVWRAMIAAALESKR